MKKIFFGLFTFFVIIDNPCYAVAPTTQTSVIYFSAITTTSLTLKWTNGNGSNRAVFMKAGSGAITNPSNNTTYKASTTFGSGTQLGASGYYCVYNSNSTSVTVTGLTQGTTYYVQSFEYNGGAGAEQYYTDTATANPNNHEAAPTGTSYFTVGSGAPTYSALETAHNAATAANPYVIELLPNYSYASETLPITLNWQTNRSSTNTITIRPQMGVTSISMSGANAGASIFDWENKYVTLDGRAGATGSSVTTIENTSTSSKSTAFDINSSGSGPVDSTKSLAFDVRLFIST